jgi:phage terminase small subunit
VHRKRRLFVEYLAIEDRALIEMYCKIWTVKLVTVKLVTDRTFTCNHVQTRKRSVCQQL